MASRRTIQIAIERMKVRKARKRTLRAPKFPRGVELEYMRSLIGISRDTSALIKADLFPWLEKELTPENGVHLDAATPNGLYKIIEGLRIKVEDSVLGKAFPVAKKMVDRTEAANLEALNVVWRQVTGATIFAKDPKLRAAMDTRVRTNVDLIRSISDRQLEQVEAVVRQEISAGSRVESIQKAIQERFDVSESRAALIARDQVGKWNAQLSETRQRDLGVTRYTWQTSGDERVRGNPEGKWPKGLHYDLNGQMFSYDDPPVTNEAGDTNNPGEDYSCRCTAIPDIEGVLEDLGI